jgi:ankyrin repeat protein
MLAAQYSKLKCAKLLLEADADRNVKDCDGRAAIDHVSRLRGCPELQKLLSDN